MPARTYGWPHVLLYNSQVSGNCYKVRLLLAQLELSCELEEVDVVERAAKAALENLLDYSDRADLLEHLNPALRIPTLVLDDGRPIAESNAILCYLADRTPLLPDDRFEHASVMQWLFFEQFSHAPYIAGARFLLAYARKPIPSFLIDERQKLGYAALAAMEQAPHASARSSPPSVTRSPISRCTPTRTSRTRAASISPAFLQSEHGSVALPHNPATCRSLPDRAAPRANPQRGLRDRRRRRTEERAALSRRRHRVARFCDLAHDARRTRMHSALLRTLEHRPDASLVSRPAALGERARPAELSV